MKKNISIGLDKELYEDIKKISEENKNELCSISLIVSKLLEDFIAEHKKKQLIECYRRIVNDKEFQEELKFWDQFIGDGLDEEDSVWEDSLKDVE